MEEHERAGIDGCPHINLNDNRCGSRFCLGRLDQAFTVCFGSYHGCPMFHRINHELTEAQQADQRQQQPKPLVSLTSDGRTVSLRATGS